MTQPAITEDAIYDLAFAFREPLESALQHAVQDYEARHEICKKITEAMEALIDAKIARALQQAA